jgi:hypothetical protein
VPKSFFSGSADAVGKHRTQAFKFAVYQYSHRAFARAISLSPAPMSRRCTSSRAPKPGIGARFIIPARRRSRRFNWRRMSTWPGGIDAVHLKDRFGDVETDCRNRLHGCSSESWEH